MDRYTPFKFLGSIFKIIVTVVVVLFVGGLVWTFFFSPHARYHYKMDRFRSLQQEAKTKLGTIYIAQKTHFLLTGSYSGCIRELTDKIKGRSIKDRNGFYTVGLKTEPTGKCSGKGCLSYKIDNCEKNEPDCWKTCDFKDQVFLAGRSLDDKFPKGPRRKELPESKTSEKEFIVGAVGTIGHWEDSWLKKSKKGHLDYWMINHEKKTLNAKDHYHFSSAPPRIKKRKVHLITPGRK